MRNVSASTFGLMTAGFIAVAGLAVPAMGQCTNNPAGAIQDNDDQVCGNTTPDANGGCNVSPEAFQSLGVLNSNSNYKIAGKCGTYGTGGVRDIDWFSFTVATACKVQINAIVNSTAQSSIIQVIENDCDGDVLATSELTGCNSVPSDFNGIYVEPGKTYIFLLTTPFEADTDPLTPAIHGCASYVVDIVTADGDSGCSGVPATARCDKAHAGTGCEDWACCNDVCFANPLCCVLQWDSGCAVAAQTECVNYLFYDCQAGGPVNDCATGATQLTVGDPPVNFDTTGAGVDGWLIDNCQNALPFQRNVWAKVTAPSSGNLLTAIAGTNLTGTLEFYNLGSGGLSDPQAQLADAYVGCINVTGAGLTVAVNGLLGGDEIYIRFAQTGAAGQTFTLETAFDFVIFNTGGNNAVIFNGTLTNLGYSSGDTGAGNPQRWMAVPFNVPEPPAAGDNNGWDATAIVGKGFIPTGTGATTQLAWTIWNRVDFILPVDGDQVAGGVVPMPVGVDEAEDSAANAAHQINLATPLTLCPGDYYLTLYGTDPTPPLQLTSNWAWFTGAQNGIFMTNGSGPFGYRSAAFPTPGFVVYTTPAVVVPAELNPNSAYSCAFRVLGAPSDTKGCAPKTPPCLGDYNDDGQRDGADLGTLLGGWGTAGTDLTGDGNTDGADLGVFLGAWGPCPL